MSTNSKPCRIDACHRRRALELVFCWEIELETEENG
jgi:hypothetical protein